MNSEDLIEEITVFPLQDTFNCDNMIIDKEKDGEADGICDADKQAGGGQ